MFWFLALLWLLLGSNLINFKTLIYWEMVILLILLLFLVSFYVKSNLTSNMKKNSFFNEIKTKMFSLIIFLSWLVGLAPALLMLAHQFLSLISTFDFENLFNCFINSFNAFLTLIMNLILKMALVSCYIVFPLYMMKNFWILFKLSSGWGRVVMSLLMFFSFFSLISSITFIMENVLVMDSESLNTSGSELKASSPDHSPLVEKADQGCSMMMKTEVSTQTGDVLTQDKRDASTQTDFNQYIYVPYVHTLAYDFDCFPSTSMSGAYQEILDTSPESSDPVPLDLSTSSSNNKSN